MDLLILAGGMGSRFGGLKQIEPIHHNGEYIIDYSIYDAIKAGFDRVVFLIKKEIYDIFRETVGKRVESKIDVEYCFQELDDLPNGFNIPEGREKPWGTAHAIWCCKDVIKDNFAIINADDFYGRDAFMTIAKELRANKDQNKYFGVGYLVKNTITDNGAVKRGIITADDQNILMSIDESNIEKQGDKIVARYLKGGEPFEISPETLVSMNVWGFTPKLFDYIDKGFNKFYEEVKVNPLKSEYLIPDVIDQQVKDGSATAVVLDTTSTWYGVTYREDKDGVVEAINNMVKNGEYPDNLWA